MIMVCHDTTDAYACMCTCGEKISTYLGTVFQVFSIVCEGIEWLLLSGPVHKIMSSCVCCTDMCGREA